MSASASVDPLTVLVGDCRESLRSLEAASVQCCVTSPPYWGLRDYGTAPLDWPEVTFVPVAGLPPLTIPAMQCCLGLEREPWAFVGHQVAVFREVARVLKADGTLWLNLGDGYASNAGGYNGEGSMGVSHNLRISKKTMSAVVKNKTRVPASGLKAKDLVGMPWRVALALQADGWWLRSDVIWHKPNPMPESVTDRPTKAHEYLFLLARREGYYYDAEAIKEAATQSTVDRLAQDVENQAGSPRAHAGGKTNGNMKAVGGVRRRNSFARETKNTNGAHGQKPQFRPDREPINYEASRNKRTVWTVPTFSFKDAHFATYPPDLIKPCILAGSRPGDVVLDPFGGSGTTGAVALERGRRAVLCELNAEYAKLIDQRCHATMGLGL